FETVPELFRVFVSRIKFPTACAEITAQAVILKQTARQKIFAASTQTRFTKYYESGIITQIYAEYQTEKNLPRNRG
ncbi:MAG: hypothetical protein K2G38_05000, partial [Clostridia bacterium]|nr:hypothetical protein [Clostridia bacterium]